MTLPATALPAACRNRRRACLPLICLAGVALMTWIPAFARACPFCNAVQMTLSEEIAGADAAVLARLADQAAASAQPAEGESDAAAEAEPGEPIAQQIDPVAFEVVEVLKGADLLADTRRIQVLYFGRHAPGTHFLVLATDPSNLAWSTPMALGPRAIEYVSQLVKLPSEGADRLAFFQKHLEDEDPLLAQDAYDEFAKAPYSALKDLRERMDRPKLLGWIQDPGVSATRRRLYLTMVGVCGQPDDVVLLEQMLRRSDRESRSALDALIACYLILKGPEGMAVVEELFLDNLDAEYTDTYSAIMALRFIGQETEAIPRPRLLEGFRHILDRPQLADLVIPDLARWQDWSVMDKLVTLFKEATEETSWVRVPVVNYLRACPLPQAQQHLDELAKIDPESVKRATQFFPLGAPAAPPAAAPAGDPALAETDQTELELAGLEKAETSEPAAGEDGDFAAAQSSTGTAETGAAILDPAESNAVQQPQPDASTANADPAPPAEGPSASAAGSSDKQTPQRVGRAVPRASADKYSDPLVRGTWVVVIAAVAGAGVLLLLLAILRPNRGRTGS